MSFNWVDILLAIVLLMTMSSGFKQGLTGEIFGTIGVFLALCFSFKYTHSLADYCYLWVKVPIIFLRIFSFFLILCFSYFVLQFVKLATQKYGESTHVYRRIDRLGGILIGLLKGIILSFIFIIFLLSLPFKGMREQMAQTYIASTVIFLAPSVFSYITDSWKNRKIILCKQYLTRLSHNVPHPFRQMRDSSFLKNVSVDRSSFSSSPNNSHKTLSI